jgi:antitoxin component of MazEF toxin-antitoxin module
MTKLKHQVFNQTKTGISIPTSILKEHLGLESDDMVFAVMANGRILLKRFSPADLTDATDRALLGFATPSETHQLEAVEPVSAASTAANPAAECGSVGDA